MTANMRAVVVLCLAASTVASAQRAPAAFEVEEATID